MEMECEEIVVELHSSITTPHETVNGNLETIENDTESKSSEANQAQSNLLVPAENSLTNPGTCLECDATPNKTDFLISSSRVSLR